VFLAPPTHQTLALELVQVLHGTPFQSGFVFHDHHDPLSAADAQCGQPGVVRADASHS